MEIEINNLEDKNKTYVNVYYNYNWYCIKKENILLFLGYETNKKLTKQMVKDFMEKYY